MDLSNLTDDELQYLLDQKRGDGGVTRGQAAMRGASDGFTFGLNNELTAASEASGLMSETPRLGGMVPGVRPEVRERVNRMPADPISAGVGAVRMGLERLAPNVFGSGAGDQYDVALERERDLGREALQQYPGSYIAGGVAGAAANPLHWAMPKGAPTALARAGQSARIAAPISALHGFGQGEGGFANRLGSAATSAALGGAFGGAAGALIGPRGATATRQAGQRASDVAEAAQRQGVDVPLSVATDSRIAQEAGYRLGQTPTVIGGPIQSATRRATGQLEDGVRQTAQAMGGTTRETAGAGVRGAAQRWIDTQARLIDDRIYGSVAKAMPGNAMGPLNSTRKTVSTLASRADEAAVTDPALNIVKNALAREGGMTFQGMQNLRSVVGRKLRQARNTQSPSEPSYAQIYGALSDDMRNVIQRQGGPVAKRAWERANRVHAQIENRSSELRNIIGRTGDAEPVSIYNRLLGIMTDARANTARLTQVRRALGPEAWDDFAGSVVAQLGRNRAGEFGPGRFVSDWQRMTPRAQQILVRDEGHRKAINDYVTIATRFRDQGRQFANPSGSGTTAAGLGLAAWIFTDPTTALGSIGGGRVIAEMLSRPATARTIARYSRAYNAMINRPSESGRQTLEQAGRKLAADIGSEMGLPVDQVLRALTQAPSRADDENQP